MMAYDSHIDGAPCRCRGYSRLALMCPREIHTHEVPKVDLMLKEVRLMWVWCREPRDLHTSVAVSAHPLGLLTPPHLLPVHRKWDYLNTRDDAWTSDGKNVQCQNKAAIGPLTSLIPPQHLLPAIHALSVGQRSLVSTLPDDTPRSAAQEPVEQSRMQNVAAGSSHAIVVRAPRLIATLL
jgi:hypothetical protein